MQIAIHPLWARAGEKAKAARLSWHDYVETLTLYNSCILPDWFVCLCFCQQLWMHLLILVLISGKFHM